MDVGCASAPPTTHRSAPSTTHTSAVYLPASLTSGLERIHAVQPAWKRGGPVHWCTVMLLLVSSLHMRVSAFRVLGGGSSMVHRRCASFVALGSRPVRHTVRRLRVDPWRVPPQRPCSSTTSTSQFERSSRSSARQLSELNTEPNVEPSGAAVAPLDLATLTATWRDLPVCNPRVDFKSWSVSTSGRYIQAILNSTLTQPYLAHRLSDPLDHLHVRIKLVHDDPTEQESTERNSRKLILLHPDTPFVADLPEPVRTFLCQQVTSDGPVVTMTFNYSQFTASYLLERLLPLDAHPVPTAFETVGHVAHLNLRPPHVPYQYLIGDVLRATLPTIDTVLTKVGEVSGPFRTFDLHVLAGRPDTNVTVVESGVTLEFDLSRVYWCSRLSEERQRLLRDEILVAPQSETSLSRVVVADVFSGVGALVLQAAVADRHGIELWVNDWNPDAVAALRENAARNGVADCFTRISCGDTFDFLVDLGLAEPREEATVEPCAPIQPRIPRKGPKRSQPRPKKAPTPVVRLPDHVVMNFPLDAPKFLGALRWWPADTGMEPRVHVYTFARATDGTVSAADVAIDLVAHQLLPQSIVTYQRRNELNDEYDCRIRVHMVRDVAPGKRVFCVSFTATSKLLRHMRGDFS